MVTTDFQLYLVKTEIAEVSVVASVSPIISTQASFELGSDAYKHSNIASHQNISSDKENLSQL